MKNFANNFLKTNKSELLKIALYAVWQKEFSDINETMHLQGIVISKKRTKLGTIKKLVSDKGHFEAVRDYEKAKKYVTKQATRVAGPWPFSQESATLVNKSKTLSLQKKLI